MNPRVVRGNKKQEQLFLFSTEGPATLGPKERENNEHNTRIRVETKNVKIMLISFLFLGSFVIILTRLKKIF